MNKDQLRLRQFDERIRKSKPVLHALASDKGWIRTIRNLLGMTTSQLAKRAKMSQPNVCQTEDREIEGSVSLNTLKKLAEAMNCNFVYGFVPKAPLEELVQERIQKTAETIVARTTHTMNLEMQGTHEAHRNELIEMVEEDLRKKRLSRIWDDE